MDTGWIVLLCLLVGAVAFIIGAMVTAEGLKNLFCKHDWEEVYKANSYQKEGDIEKGLTNWVDIGFICKKCKAVKRSSITFYPIEDR